MNVKINNIACKDNSFINSIGKDTLQNLSKGLFRGKGDYASLFLEHLEMISSRCRDEHIGFTENIKNILTDLNNQAARFALERNTEIENGIIPADKELFNSQFYDKNKDNLTDMI